MQRILETDCASVLARGSMLLVLHSLSSRHLMRRLRYEDGRRGMHGELFQSEDRC